MRTFVLLATWLLMAQAAHALTVEMRPDSEDVPVFGAFTGVAVITNDDDENISIAAPSMLLGALRYEVRDQSGVSYVGVSSCVLASEYPTITLGSGERVFVPFYLMKSKGRFLSNEVGPVHVRCILGRAAGSSGNFAEVASPWVELRVTAEASSVRWREYFESIEDVMFPFEYSTFSLLDPSFTQFRGSRYYRLHVIYQDLNISAFGHAQTPDLVRSFRFKNAELMSVSKSASPMWEALAAGAYCLRSNDFADGDYFLSR